MKAACEKVFLPKVSIVIPAFNASNYLSQAIDSALAQTYSNFEIIVVNDGSKDDGATREVALSYGDKIRYFEKENGGSSSALNMGIANMTGEWFSWLSHDDLYVPEKLEKQITYMNSLCLDPSVLTKHIFFSASSLIDANGKTIRAPRAKRRQALSERIASFPHNGYLVAEPTVYCFQGCSCLIHRDAFADIGTFDEELRLVNDLDLWFRLYAANYKLHYLPDMLVKGRIHAKQVSRSIGFSYHNSEQDMLWNRSLDFLLANYPEEESLFFAFGKNAYLKTRSAEGDRAFAHIRKSRFKKAVMKTVYKCSSKARHFAKTVYLKIKA